MAITKAAVTACSTCGALYSPTPGDGRVCDACRITVAEDPAAAPAPTPLFASEEDPVAPARRPKAGRAFAGASRSLRTIVRAVVVVALLGGIAAGIVSQRERIVRTWNAMRRHTVSQAWTEVKQRSVEAWTALRRHIPIDSLQADSGSDDSGKDSKRRRSHPGKAKRGKGEHAIAAK